MKKIFGLFIVVATLFSTIVSAKVYDDVTEDAWYKEAVDFVSEKGLIKVNDNSFFPNNQTTRAEYVYALYASSQENEKKYTPHFDDVDEKNPFFSAIGWAETNAVSNGVENNLFLPNDGLTREEAITFLYRSLPQLGIVPDTPNNDLSAAFNDSESISEWAKESVNTLLNMKFIHGTDENKLEPQKTLSNAETATILYNVFCENTTKSTNSSPIYEQAKFEAVNYIADNGKKINYWLFTPQNRETNMPMIVYLHGSHSQGDDINLVLNEDFCRIVSNGEFDDVPAYILFPQLPSSYKGWGNMQYELIELIDAFSSDYAVNKRNISLVGFSLGGTATINIATAYPGYFSKIAPIAGGSKNMDANINALKNTPVWAFVGSEDVIVKPDTVKELINSLKNISADAQITVFEGAEHTDVPSLVFSDKKIKLVDWLIGQ